MNLQKGIDNYISRLSCTTARRLLEQASSWKDVESELANWHLALMRMFVFDPHLTRSFSFEIPESPIPQPDRKAMRLAAVNWRGLYVRDGRETLIDPCGTFQPRTSQERRHRILHATYLRMLGKADSINQVFLANTPYRSLAIYYSLAEDSSALVDDQHATITISADLTSNLLPNGLAKRWSEEISKVLRSARRPISSKDDFLAIQRHIEDRVLDLLASNFALFEQLTENVDNHPSSMAKLAMFHDWLRSFAWLRFYCRPEHAGEFFYTTRLPTIEGTERILPECSVSLVSADRLADSVLNVFRSLGAALRSNSKYRDLIASARKRFDGFMEKARGQPDADDPNRELWHLIPQSDGDLPVDFRKLAFLCEVARHLAGQQHEGKPLHFRFLLGFSHDHVDGLTRDAFDDIGANLKWPFPDNMLSEPEAVAKWVKANDLPLQRWDYVLFFSSEVEEEPYPIATHILRLKSRKSGTREAIVDEYQVRNVLREITSSLRSTAALLVSSGGVTLIHNGKTYILKYHDQGNRRVLVPLVRGDAPLRDVFFREMEEQFRQVSPRRYSTRDIEEITGIVFDLCEAIATLGHGALLVIRKAKWWKGSHLSPLGPVWSFRSDFSISQFKDDIMTFALLASLDGATEIVLQHNNVSNAIVRFRRSVEAPFSIWLDDKDGTGAKPNPRIRPEPRWASMIGLGTRHRSAYAFSKENPSALVLTVSADGPVRLWRRGGQVHEYRFKP